MRNLIPILIFIGGFSVLAVNDSYYEDEIREQAHYCDMVKNGHWPNYKEVDCDEK